jgi:hypothetical protein
LQQKGLNINKPISQAAVAEGKFICQQCKKEHKIYAKLIEDMEIDNKMLSEGFEKLPKDNKLKCSCGFETNLVSMRNQLETIIRKKIID